MLLLRTVARERLGEEGAKRAVLYLAIQLLALYLQAAYSESLDLMLALLAFVLAERGCCGAAGVAVGLALLTRSAGLALVPPLLWIACRRGDAIARLVPGIALFAAFPRMLWSAVGRSMGLDRRSKAVGPRALLRRPARRPLVGTHALASR